MSPVRFKEANKWFGPPPDMEESQVGTIHAFVGEAPSGSCDGVQLVVTAWMPTPEELATLNSGEPVFITFMGGLPPHLLTTSFKQAINPA